MEGDFMYHLSPENLLAARIRFEKKTQCTQVPRARGYLRRSGLDFESVRGLLTAQIQNPGEHCRIISPTSELARRLPQGLGPCTVALHV
jgi:hypothetical protein